MKTKIISITFLFFVFTTMSYAQNNEEILSDSTKEWFAVQSVNLVVGYYSPEMSYWNDTYLPAKGIPESFGGSAVFGANITFSIHSNFRARVGASYWKGEVEGNQGSTVDGLKIGFTRFSLGLLYGPKVFSFSGFQPYLGAEATTFLINNEYNIHNEIISQNGQDMSFAPVLGIDKAFGPVNIGIEGKYNLGKYIQEESFTETIEHEVGINGLEVSLSVGFRF